MDDKTIMANILNNVKGACGLMMHGTIESSTPNINSTFKCELDNCLTMQNQIYAKMSQKGWYPAQNVEQSKITQAKQQYSNSGDMSSNMGSNMNSSSMNSGMGMNLSSNN